MSVIQLKMKRSVGCNHQIDDNRFPPTYRNFSVYDLGTDALLVSVQIWYIDCIYSPVCNSNMAYILCNQILNQDIKETQSLSSYLVWGKWQDTQLATFHNNNSH